MKFNDATLSHEEMSQVMVLAQKIMSVYYSGVYITGFDIAAIGEHVGYTYPIHNREEMMITLLTDAKKDDKLATVAEAFGHLIAERHAAYKRYEENYPKVATILRPLTLKSRNIGTLIARPLARNPYDA